MLQHQGMPQHVFAHQHNQHQGPFAFHDQQQQHHQQQHTNNQQYNRLGQANNGVSNPQAMLSGGGPVGLDQRQHMNGSMGAGQGMGGIGAGGMGVGGDHGPSGGMSEDDRKTMQHIVELLNSNTREGALLELSKKREAVPELALVLWHSFGMSWWLDR